MSGPSLQPGVILFDGVCNLCNGAVQFILLRDPQARFRFASLQSETGQRLRAAGQVPEDTDSFVLLEGGRTYLRSDAALCIARGLGGPWRLLYVLILLPRPLRDAVYCLIARNRYRIFGRREACLLPRPEWRSRFL
ncbi:putative DCC family thiol-disulfide oxidoreductase YuxK [Deinobacterium chartae]|uniref:Putative DCC family thiol-disulfide oxidoreductase YuxK n=1 Tax=Deinobacterium chartae TaxID=521158 RepID=A0A841I0B6_9DEIO|nr:thiol-disulfide oxidoreductase DCC family protein [Deinobacterium chartae]MBB6097698.1 putative DCC family thiol-disulfide oxidoreductase YuxK [Deinobacterium chartae]